MGKLNNQLYFEGPKPLDSKGYTTLPMAQYSQVIPNPYVGLKVYSAADDKEYKITALTEDGLHVAEYEEEINWSGVIYTMQEKQDELQGAASAAYQNASEAKAKVEQLVGLEGSNFLGIFTSMPVTSELLDGMDKTTGWCLVGDDLANLKAYKLSRPNASVIKDPEQIGGTYDFTDYSGVKNNVEKIISLFQQTNETGFHILDKYGNIGMRYDNNGLDFALISNHAIEILKSYGFGSDLSNIVQTKEKGFFIIDANNRIGLKLDNDGLSAININETQTGSSSNNLDYILQRFFISEDAANAVAEKRAIEARKSGKMIFEDNFDHLILDKTKWQCEIGYQRNQEPQYYDADNVSVSDSVATLTLKKENKHDGYEWTSGSITTQDRFHFGVNTLCEARIRCTPYSGVWPAFWTWCADINEGSVSWPDLGEFDIFELFGANPYTSTLHWKSGSSVVATHNGVNPSEWHIFGSEFLEDRWNLYIDNVLVTTKMFTTDDMLALARTRQKIILNVASGRTSGKLTDNCIGKKMQIDWVRVIGLGNHPKYPTSLDVENDTITANVDSSILIHTILGGDSYDKTVTYTPEDRTIIDNKFSVENGNALCKNKFKALKAGTTRVQCLTNNGLVKIVNINVI